MKRAADTNVPRTAEVIAPANTSGRSLTSARKLFFYKEPISRATRYLMGVYEKVGFLSTANSGFKNPNGSSFTEAEIEKAFLDGKGPYRTACYQVDFYGTQNCKVVVNPLDRSREVLLMREASNLTSRLAQLESLVSGAIIQNDDTNLVKFLYDQPSITNFIADDVDRWTSPLGTWRMRLVQDAGPTLVGGTGFAVLNDAEMFITAPGKPEIFYKPSRLTTGPLVGVLSIWMPSNEVNENLNNFSLVFHWDDRDRTLTKGQIRGERRNWDDGNQRIDYAATFNAFMLSGNRIKGYWYNYDSDIAGRFEMIRGIARYTI